MDIPSELDHKLVAALLGIVAAPRTSVAEFARDLAEKELLVLGVCAERMATMAVKCSSEDALLAGMVALMIYASAVDRREALLLVSILIDAARRIGGPDSALAKTSRFPESELIENFLHREPSEQRIDKMGYEFRGDDGHIGYRRLW